MALGLLLAGCGAEPAVEAPTAAEVPREAPEPRLQCMPAALVSLRLPLSEGFALEHDAAPTSRAAIDCVLGLFGKGALKSPAAFDRDYGRVFAYHEEDGTLALASLPRHDMQLFRLGGSGGANVWLLRVRTGIELEGPHYDILFSTAQADGALVDQMLVGAMGTLYRRDYDIDSALAFAIAEDTGREADAGPGYRARYRVDRDGRFSLVSGQVLPPPSMLPAGAPAAPQSGTSLETLPGRFGELAPIRALLFEDGSVDELAIVRIEAGQAPAMLAIGIGGVASPVLYVLGEVPSPMAGGNTLYRVSSVQAAAPAGALSAELRDQRWSTAADGRVRIALDLRYAMPRPGGDPPTGDPVDMPVDATLVAWFDPDDGALTLERAD